jgi:diguanylate cyclase (GGDEF)-like protein/PAS domain S-box-containing protein
MADLLDKLLKTVLDHFRRRGTALQEAEEQYQVLFNRMGEGIFRTSAEGRLLATNPAAARILGYDSPGHAVRELTDLASQLYVDASQRAILLQGMNEKGSHEMDLEFRRRDGRTIWMRVAGRRVIGANGKDQYYEGLLREITDEKRADLFERDRASILEMIALNCPLPEILQQICSGIERQHPAWKTLVQRLEGNQLFTWAMGSLPAEMATAMDGMRAAPDTGACGEAATLGQAVVSNNMCNSPAATLGIRTCWAIPIHAGANDILGTLCIYHESDIQPSAMDMKVLGGQAKLCAIAVEHQMLTERLRDKVLHDPLTGLPNRMSLESQLRDAMKSRSSDSGVALLFLNFDGFRVINDSLGHDSGDILLQMAAARLQSTLQAGQVLARVGADQFIILLPSPTSRENAEAVANGLLASLGGPFDVLDHEVYLTASIGASLYPTDAQDPLTLQRNANIALNEAKSLGRSRCQFFRPELNARALERLELTVYLRSAIDNGELSLQYQPQVNRANQIVGVEALLRWNHPKLGGVPPNKFIPLAEEIGMIVPIGNWVLDQACAQAAKWHREGFGFLRVAVNVSAVQFAQTDFVDRVRQTLMAHALSPAGLEIELTESLLMKNTADGAEKLTVLRDMGVTTAIDDFGTGYSSLAYLQKLPIDTLKIDRSFVCEIRDAAPNSEYDDRYAVIRAITSLAKSLRMKLIAEGVETEVQRQFLARMGCNLFQGYLFGRPTGVAEIDRLLIGSSRELAQSA